MATPRRCGCGSATPPSGTRPHYGGEINWNEVPSISIKLTYASVSSPTTTPFSRPIHGHLRPAQPSCALLTPLVNGSLECPRCLPFPTRAGPFSPTVDLVPGALAPGFGDMEEQG